MAQSKALEDTPPQPHDQDDSPEPGLVEVALEGSGAAPLFEPDDIPRAIEAVLLAVDKPLPAPRIAEALGLDRSGVAEVRQAIHALNEHYEHAGRSFRIEAVAGGYRIMTLPEYAPAVAAIRGMRESQRLSRAAIETLAIVAYKQPITRVQIEGIRGVATGEVLRTLLEKRLITISGRAEELGRPMLYATSKHFLEVFGLASIKDLPPVGDLFPGMSPELSKKQNTPGNQDTPGKQDTPGNEPGTGAENTTDHPEDARPEQDAADLDSDSPERTPAE